MKIENVCVYCASNRDAQEIFQTETKRLGQLLAENHINCICGAGDEGLMGLLSDSVLAHGGKMTGVIPQFMVERGWAHQGLQELIVVKDMHERKQTMAEKADAFIALPGGCGTLEELLEIITWRQLGLYNKPIIILNIKGYYTPLLEMFEKAIEEKMMKESHRGLWTVAESADQIPALLEELSKTEFKVEAKY